MPINNVQPVGDDQRWKREVEKEIEALKKLVTILQSQINSRSQ